MLVNVFVNLPLSSRCECVAKLYERVRSQARRGEFSLDQTNSQNDKLNVLAPRHVSQVLKFDFLFHLSVIFRVSEVRASEVHV